MTTKTEKCLNYIKRNIKILNPGVFSELIDFYGLNGKEQRDLVGLIKSIN